MNESVGFILHISLLVTIFMRYLNKAFEISVFHYPTVVGGIVKRWLCLGGIVTVCVFRYYWRCVRERMGMDRYFYSVRNNVYCRLP